MSPRAILRFVRHAPDRLLHRRRRAALVATLRRSGPPDRVMFVCLGNICRSPYAAERLRAILSARDRRIAVDSAGLIGPGRSSPQEMLDAATQRGLDLTGHRSQLVTDALVAAPTLVIVMSPEQRREVARRVAAPPGRILMLGDLDPWPIATRTIQDPFGRSPASFADCAARLDRCVEALADAWS